MAKSTSPKADLPEGPKTLPTAQLPKKIWSEPMSEEQQALERAVNDYLRAAARLETAKQPEYIVVLNPVGKHNQLPANHPLQKLRHDIEHEDFLHTAREEFAASRETVNTALRRYFNQHPEAHYVTVASLDGPVWFYLREADGLQFKSVKTQADEDREW